MTNLISDKRRLNLPGMLILETRATGNVVNNAKTHTVITIIFAWTRDILGLSGYTMAKYLSRLIATNVYDDTNTEIACK